MPVLLLEHPVSGPFLHGFQGIQPETLEASLGDTVYLGRGVKDLGA